MTTIWIKEDTKKGLDEVKVHPRETYDEVVKRLIFVFKEAKKRRSKH